MANIDNPHTPPQGFDLDTVKAREAIKRIPDDAVTALHAYVRAPLFFRWQASCDGETWHDLQAPPCPRKVTA